MVITKKLKLTLCIVLVLTTVLFTTSVFASFEQKQLGVSAIQQEESNWCWAACTEMVLDFFGESVTQSEIVTFIYGSAVNQGGDVFDIQDALSNWGCGSAATYSSKSFSTIVDEIEDNQPMIAGRSGHAEVLYGYFYNDFGNEDVYYIDPWDASCSLETYSIYSSSWNGGTVYGINN